jgi:hypothetical protein
MPIAALLSANCHIGGAVSRQLGRGEKPMSGLDFDGDASADMLERRWFAAYKSAEAMRAECDMLREVLVAAEAAWRRALTQLAELETLRDVLGDELAWINECDLEPAPQVVLRPVRSAA